LFKYQLVNFFLIKSLNGPDDWHIPCFKESKGNQQPINEEVIMAATYIETRKAFTRINSGFWANCRERIAEGFWFSLCLALFIVLGPFSAPIVLVFLFFNNDLNNEMQEPESLNNEHV
jgi:hypothetical protein